MSKKRGKERPRAAHDPSPRKAPSAGGIDPAAGYHAPMSWGLRALDLDGPHGWRACDAEHLAQLQRQLVELEGETLAYLQRERRAKLIPVSDLRPPPQERLLELGLEFDELWELRLLSKWRVWGTVEGSVFFVLWWDPEEDVCGPPPKGEFRRG
jgi:hypothetical protein